MINEQIISDFFPAFILISIAFFLGFIIVCLPLFTAKRQFYFDKISQYECGFKSIDSIRKKIDVKFYLVSILFIVFDVEIAFLFPWATVVKDMGLNAFVPILIFLSVLTVGFIYEWKMGALD